MNHYTIPARLLAAAQKAWLEGRLGFRCTDRYGRSCNGGSAEALPIGKWSPAVEPALCESGWHLTHYPHQWRGDLVWLCEARGIGGREEGKFVARQIRPLALCDPRVVRSSSVIVRALFDPRRADLSGANLSGAYLNGANLYGANLRGAYLGGACLSRADLRGAYLGGANLSRAYLSGADLGRADLGGACLSRANLSRADLSGAYLGGANLSRADLSGAYLGGANLRGAYGRDDWSDLVARGALREVQI